MKSLRLLLSIPLLLLGLLGSAQTPTTQGTEFWVSFMRNGHWESTASMNELTLIISAKEGCHGSVSNADGSWTHDFNVANHSVTVVEVPSNYAYNEQVDGVANKGIHVVATDTISLYVGNESQNSYDASNVLPVGALGTHYLLQTYQSIVNNESSHSDKIRSSFLVVATEPETDVQIIPSVVTSGNHPAGQPYVISLNQGQCYHVMSRNAGTANDSEGDFSGTTIDANKPIAVFNGNCLTSVPVGCFNGYDHVFEQAMPTDNWGKRFVVTGTRVSYPMSIGDDQVKVTALDNATTVTCNGQPLFTLNSGESREFGLKSDDLCAFIQADKPVAVYLYQPSHGSNSSYGDPSMVWISPVEQTMEEVTFSTFDVPNLETHYVNIVCHTEDVGLMTLDGQPIGNGNAFAIVDSATDLSFARYAINSGAHILRCPGGFTAHVYGINTQIGYAYSVGSSAKKLTKQLYVDDVLSTEYPDGYTTCQNESVQFRFESNYEFDHVAWSFGDGGIGIGAELSHVYTSANDYDMQAVVFREDEAVGVVVPFDTVGLTIRVKATYDTITKEYTTCASTFFYEGTDYPVPGVYSVPLSTQYGCDSIVTLNLMQGEELWDFDTVTACELHHWRGHDYSVSDTIEDRVYDVTPEGCDSVYVLYLTIVNPPLDTERELFSCEPYDWHGIFCDHSGDFTMSFTSGGVCDYDSILHFTLVDIPPVYESLSGCEPVLWHGIEVAATGPYEYTAPGGGYCDTLYHLDFVLEPLPEIHIDTTVCNSLEWNGEVYTQTDTYSYSIPVDDDCDTLVVISLTVNQAPQLGEIQGVQHLAIANSFWAGTYNYYIDSTGMDTSEIQWELLGDTPWRLVAHGASCTVTATTLGEAQLRAWSDGEGDCLSESSITLSSSSFGVAQDELNPVELYPNPTDDRVIVKGEELVDMVIYDLMGQQLMSASSPDGSQIEADVNHLKPALYMVKIQTRKGNKLLLFSVL